MSVELITVGTCTLSYSQAGTSNFEAVGPVTASFAVSKASQTITFAALASKTMGDASFNLTASASSGLTVVYASSTNSVCTIAGISVTLVSPGTCTITASQTGNGNYEAATAVAQSFTVFAAGRSFDHHALSFASIRLPSVRS